MVVRKVCCLECGEDFKTERKEALFCSSPCRLDFNRRRRDRGAELYDFIMAGTHTDLVNRLIAAYKQADKVKREGRPSWQRTQQALFNIPQVFGTDGDKR